MLITQFFQSIIQMKNNLIELINQYGNPNILIDHWTNQYDGYAIWGFEETVIWDYNGLHHLNQTISKPCLNDLQNIFDKWKKKSSDLAAVGFINYNFKNIIYPHIKFKNYNKDFPYLFFVKPQKIKRYIIKSEEVNIDIDIKLLSDIIFKNDYKEKIRLIKNELEAGNAYQINFTMPKQYSIKNNPLDYYLNIRNTAKPKYGYYLNLNDFNVLSFSPELFFQKENNIIISLPMKGTRPRSGNIIEDNKYKKELENATKDRSEHLMILDLIRNDIGKIANYGSVYVQDMFKVESYETVHQMTSKVIGEVSNSINEVNILEALFPGGSITGAPKESAMTIIDNIENYSRDIYTGALGYIKSNGDMNFNMPIRTMTIKNNKAIYPVGGGIVWDSNYQEEWEEAQLKSKIIGV